MTAKKTAWLIILALVVSMMPIAGAEQAIEPPQAAEEWTSICTGHFHIGMPASWYYDFDAPNDTYRFSPDPIENGQSALPVFVSEGDFTAYIEEMTSQYTEEQIARLVMMGFLGLTEEDADTIPVRSGVYGGLTFYMSDLPAGHQLAPATICSTWRDGYVLTLFIRPEARIDVDDLLGSIAFDPAGRKLAATAHFACDLPSGWRYTYMDSGALIASEDSKSSSAFMMILEQDMTAYQAYIPSLMSVEQVCEAVARGVLGLEEGDPVALDEVEYGGQTCYCFDNEPDNARWLLYYSDGYMMTIAFVTTASISCEEVFATVRTK